MTITVFIRYQLDPFRRDMLEAYAKRWLTIVGYWMPHEGTNNIAFGLISFQNLASYEAYRACLKSNPEGGANFRMAEEQCFIVAEERTFLRKVE